MWLRYQQVSAKMSSFDPREIVRNNDVVHATKHPLKRFEPTLRTSLRVVIPMNLDRLTKHKTNIEKFAYSKKWKDLNMEQINASRTVQQLQATIRDLDNLKYQIMDEDLDKFEKQIKPMKVEAFKAFQEFSQLQTLISTEVQRSINTSHDANVNDDGVGTAQLIDHPLQTHSESIQEPNEEGIFSEGPISRQIEFGEHDVDELKDEMAACQSWDHLRDGLIELNDLVKDFAEIVHHQQEAVDSIENNVEAAHENVNSAATLLGQASKYKAVAIPVVGAIVGGLVGGPIGLLAGFKLAGAAAAVGGGFAGYQGGKYLKKKHDGKVEVELSNLSTKNEPENIDRAKNTE